MKLDTRQKLSARVLSGLSRWRAHSKIRERFYFGLHCLDIISASQCTAHSSSPGLQRDGERRTLQDSLPKQRLAALDHQVKTRWLSPCTLSKYCHLTDNTTQMNGFTHIEVWTLVDLFCGHHGVDLAAQFWFTVEMNIAPGGLPKAFSVVLSEPLRGLYVLGVLHTCCGTSTIKSLIDRVLLRCSPGSAEVFRHPPDGMWSYSVNCGTLYTQLCVSCQKRFKKQRETFTKTPHMMYFVGDSVCYVCLWVFLARLPCWDHLQTQQCSAEPKAKLPAGPGCHNSPQLMCEGPCPTPGIQMHLKSRISSHDQRRIINSSKTLISSKWPFIYQASCFESCRKAEQLPFKVMTCTLSSLMSDKCLPRDACLLPS